MNESEIFELISKRQQLISDAKEKECAFFDNVNSTFAKLCELLKKCKMAQIQVKFKVHNYNGNYVLPNNRIILLIRSSGEVAIKDLSIDTTPQTIKEGNKKKTITLCPFININRESFEKDVHVSNKKDFLDIIDQLIKNFDDLYQAEFDTIKDFYIKEVDNCQKNLDDWESRLES